MMAPEKVQDVVERSLADYKKATSCAIRKLTVERNANYDVVVIIFTDRGPFKYIYERGA